MEAKFADGQAIQFRINESSSLGRGATADVHFVIVGDKKYAAKIYRSGTEFNAEKIASMCMMRDPSVQPSTTFAWPTALVYDNGSIIGYLMPVFEKVDHHPLNYYFDTTLLSRLNDKSIASLSNRVEIAKYLCSAIAAIHARSTFFIDLKPQNVLVNRRTNAVVILDCDGFSLLTSSGKIIPAGHVSTDYIAPEVTRERLQPSALAEPQDNYALAVILFQMFTYSQHPFQGTPVSESSRPFTNDELAAEGLYPYSLTPNPRIKPRRGSTHLFLPKDMRLLFDRSFLGDRNARVTPREWSLYFSRIIAEKRLQRCERLPNSVGHIHFRDCGCPECAREQQKVLPTPAPATPPSPIPLTPMPPIRPATPRKSSSTWQWLIAICAGAFLIFFYSISTDSRPLKPTKPTTQIPPTPIQSVPAKASQNPSDLSKVDPSKIITERSSAEFRPYSTGDKGTLSVLLQTGSSNYIGKNPILFIADNDCSPSNKEISTAQKALSSRGFRVGIVDGILGPATIKAIRDFQKAQGLQVNGELNWETAAKLKVYVAGYDLSRFKYHNRGTVFSSADGPIVRFLNVPARGFCYYLTRD
jgi:serine/threonine protein kinase